MIQEKITFKDYESRMRLIHQAVEELTVGEGISLLLQFISVTAVIMEIDKEDLLGTMSSFYEVHKGTKQGVIMQ